MATKGENTRANILQKAAELFAENGYTAVTMKDVCEATGLSRGGLYRNFSSTADMMILLMRQEQESANEVVSHNLCKKIDAIENFDGFLLHHRDYMLSPRGRLELAINQFAQTDERGREENRLRVDTAIRRTAEIIRYGQQQGKFIDGDADALAWHVLMAIGGLRTNVALLGCDRDFVIKQIELIRQLIIKQ